MTDDPNFYAWLDGELPEPQASAMAGRVAANPELAALADQHRALGNRLSAAFAPIAAAPVPDRLLAAAAPAAPVIDLASVRAQRQRRWSVTGLAMAASLAIGLTVGSVLPRADGGSFRSENGRLLAAGGLDRSLSTQLASAGESGGARVNLTFKDRSGRYCRSFEQQAQSGLACRSGGDWVIEGLVHTARQDGDYRMASGLDPALGSLIDGRIAGDPLDPQAEARALEQGWAE